MIFGFVNNEFNCDLNNENFYKLEHIELENDLKNVDLENDIIDNGALSPRLTFYFNSSDVGLSEKFGFEYIFNVIVNKINNKTMHGMIYYF